MTGLTDIQCLDSIVVDLAPKARQANEEEIKQLRESLEDYQFFKKIEKYFNNRNICLHNLLLAMISS